MRFFGMAQTFIPLSYNYKQPFYTPDRIINEKGV